MLSLLVLENFKLTAVLGLLLCVVTGLTFILAVNLKRVIDTIVHEGVSEVRETLVTWLNQSLQTEGSGLLTWAKKLLIRTIITTLESVVVDICFRIISGVFTKSPYSVIGGSLLAHILSAVFLLPTSWIIALEIPLIAVGLLVSILTGSLVIKGIREFIRSSPDKLKAATELLGG